MPDGHGTMGFHTFRCHKLARCVMGGTPRKAKTRPFCRSNGPLGAGSGGLARWPRHYGFFALSRARWPRHYGFFTFSSARWPRHYGFFIFSDARWPRHYGFFTFSGAMSRPGPSWGGPHGEPKRGRSVDQTSFREQVLGALPGGHGQVRHGGGPTESQNETVL